MVRKKKTKRTADRGAAGYLKTLGQRVRAVRAQHGMARHSLAQHSGVSLRFLAQLETGIGNPSIIVLRAIAKAMSVTLEELVSDSEPRPVDQTLIVQTLNRLSAEVILPRFRGHPKKVDNTKSEDGSVREADEKAVQRRVQVRGGALGPGVRQASVAGRA